MAYRDKKKTFTLEHFTCSILMEDCTHQKAFWMKTTPNYKILLPRRITHMVFKNKKKTYILLFCLKKINFEWLNIFPNSLHLLVPTYALGLSFTADGMAVIRSSHETPPGLASTAQMFQYTPIRWFSIKFKQSLCPRNRPCNTLWKATEKKEHSRK